MIQRINARGGNISLGAGAWIVCAALKDLGIKEKTAYPTRHKFINDFELRKFLIFDSSDTKSCTGYQKIL